MSRYEGKKVVVTGGTHGMGRATVEALLEGGAEVLLTGRTDETLDAARHELGPRARVVHSDTTSMADIEALGELVQRTLGQVDFVFVNAGYATLERLEQVSSGSYDQLFGINVKGAYFTAQRLAPLVRDGGAFVFTTSGATTLGVVGMSVYSGAKSAVRSFVRGFASELLPRGIRVNAVAPGFIKTQTMGVAAASDEERLAFEREGNEFTPMGRIGTPEEIARAVLFLAFDATFTTGIELPVDGGATQGVMRPGH